MHTTIYVLSPNICLHLGHRSPLSSYARDLKRRRGPPRKQNLDREGHFQEKKVCPWNWSSLLNLLLNGVTSKNINLGLPPHKNIHIFGILVQGPNSWISPKIDEGGASSLFGRGPESPQNCLLL